MSAQAKGPGFDLGFIENSVRVYFPSSDHSLTFPGVIDDGLALELAEMLRGVLPGTVVSVVPIARSSDELAEAEDITQRIKRRVIESRDAEQPGKAFLQGIGYWPSSDQTEG